jgi:hypothetical protein
MRPSWELYLHEVHVRLGFEVEVHPVSRRTTRPDFFVARRGEGFYLEAVMPLASSGEPSQPGSVATVREYIASAFDPDFFLKLRFASAGEETPRKQEVVSLVQQWLSSLEWEDWWRGGLGPDVPYPETELSFRGWLVGLRAFPRAPEDRGDPTFSMIGFYPSFATFPDAVADEIKPKLDEKANRYGDLDAPYVLAIWVMSIASSTLTAPQALFGMAPPLEEGRHPTDLPFAAERDGLWTPNRQHRGRVSAALAVPSFDFHELHDLRVKLGGHLLLPLAQRMLLFPLPLLASAAPSRAIAEIPAQHNPAKGHGGPSDHFPHRAKSLTNPTTMGDLRASPQGGVPRAYRR